MKSIKPNFFLDIHRKNSSGLAPIRVRSKHNCDKLIVKSTGIFCHVDDWHSKKCLPKDPHKKNLQLQLESDILSAYEELIRVKDEVNLHDVWEKLFPKSNRYSKPTSDKVYDWIDFYISNSPYSFEYLRGAKHLKVHLSGESKKGKVKAFNRDLRFCDLNQTTIDAFSKHIVKQGKSTGTVVKIVKFLRQVAKMARDSGIKVGSIEFKAPRNFKKKVRTEVRLTFPELIKLRNIQLTEDHEIHIRDMFLFLAFTGLRHSDMIKMTPAAVHGDFLHFIQSKTDDQVAVTIHKYSKPIIKKYSEGKADTDKLFPDYKQQFFNKVIKTVARKAGLSELVKVSRYSGTEETSEDKPKNKLIKSHTGRRTFSRILSLLLVPEEIIAEEMGHSGISITRHYIGNSDHINRIQLVQKAWNNAEIILQANPLMKKAS